MMVRITKRAEPAALTTYRLTEGAYFDGFGGKAHLLAQLVSEQGCLCCYCMGRITADDSTVEHFEGQTRHPDRQLVYANLMAVCPGGEGLRKKDQHCDEGRGQVKLSISPADPQRNIEDFIWYGTDGLIHGTTDAVNVDVQKTLNLNVQRLVENRSAAMDAWQQAMPAAASWTKRRLERELEVLSTASGGERKPYCGVLIYFVRKRLARMAR